VVTLADNILGNNWFKVIAGNCRDLDFKFFLSTQEKGEGEYLYTVRSAED